MLAVDARHREEVDKPVTNSLVGSVPGKARRRAPDDEQAQSKIAYPGPRFWLDEFG